MENIQRFWTCHFCKKRKDEVGILIVGPEGIAICDQCINFCNEILAERKEEKAKDRESK